MNQQSSHDGDLVRGLLVVDHDGLAFAALDDTELRHVGTDEVDRLVDGLSDGAPPAPAAAPLGARDTLQAVAPNVLLLVDHAVRAWDAAADRWVSLSGPQLRVLADTRHRVDAAHLGHQWGIAADDPDLAVAVRSLSALGLVELVEAPDVRPEPLAEPEVVEMSGSGSASDAVDPVAEGAAPAEPALLDGLPSGGAAALKVLAYRVRARSLRRARRSAVRLAATTLTRLDPSPAESSRPAPVPDEPPAMPPVGTDAVGDPSQERGPLEEHTHSAPTRWVDHRTPVFGVYHSPEHNANLGLGMIVAYARTVDEGALNRVFDLRRASIDPAPMLEELSATGRPAVLLCSDYMWSLEHNLGVSAAAKQLNERTIVVHGGPHAPSYEADAEQFLTEHPEVDVLARGEGELTIAELLGSLGPDADPLGLHERLAEVAGITYRRHHQDGRVEVVRTPDRPRATEMDRFPSPYLTGEFADVDPARWRSATVETNRGCPYGCTFCDWGQATMSRIRKFSLERVRAELEWIAARGISEVFLADSNFGIYERDVEIAQFIAELKATYGAPQQVICSFAKNTVKYTTEIVRIWVEAGICAEGSVALQTTDPVTLENVARSNIRVEKYDALADEFRSLGLPIVTDLLMGLPGATVESFKADLQRCLDQDVTPRMMETVLLPNSPMNAPEYRERFQIELDPANVLVSTSSYTREDFEEMKRLRLLFRAFEHFGLLRHLFRWLQYERGLRALDVIHEIDRAIIAEPERYPLLTWVGRYFDLVTAPPCGWPPFYDEVMDLLADRFGLEDDPELDVVLAVQLFLMPRRGRRFPDSLALEHDYVAWLQDRHQGRARPLGEYGPGELVVDDPMGVCEARIVRNGFSIRREEACDNPFWVLADWELDSALARPMATSIPYLNS
jgi:radical SAM superfamily enzyme YgiQ (UPF0313 family)